MKKFLLPLSSFFLLVLSSIGFANREDIQHRTRNRIYPGGQDVEPIVVQEELKEVKRKSDWELKQEYHRSISSEKEQLE